MQLQVRCQECHRLVSCQELRLGVGGRTLCCDCYPEETRPPWPESRLGWRKAEEAENMGALAELPPTTTDPESAGAPAETY